MQSGGSFMGSLLGTGVLLLIYHYYGWQNLLFILAAFVLFAVIPLWFYKPVEKTQSTEKQTVKLKELLLFFNDKVCRKHLLLLIFYYSGIIGILAMLKPYLVDLGYNVKEIGFMSGIIGTSTAAFSAFFGGFLIKKLGRITSFYIFSFANLSVGVYFYYLSSFVPNFWQISMAICLLWAAYGFSSVIVYTSSMDKVRPQREGTDFTLQIVVTHLSSLIIAVFSGKLGDKFGYNGLFSFQILMSLLAIVILYYNFPLKFKKK
jgi:predicted MFS family arabinose efflux permease